MTNLEKLCYQIKLTSFRHLAKNPFFCDCNLKWLSEYLHKNPIETSGARCHTPKRLSRRRLESIKEETMKCKLNSLYKLNFKYSSFLFICFGIYDASLIIFYFFYIGDKSSVAVIQDCSVQVHCPQNCVCYGSKVDCTMLNLTSIAEDIPLFTTDL